MAYDDVLDYRKPWQRGTNEEIAEYRKAAREARLKAKIKPILPHINGPRAALAAIVKRDGATVALDRAAVTIQRLQDRLNEYESPEAA